MLYFQSFPFPNGSTVDQTKRNAKRERSARDVSLSSALDSLGCVALGFPEGIIRWPFALRALEHASRLCGALKEEKGFKFSREAIDVFCSGTIALLDVKNADRFKDTGPWVEDYDLHHLLVPSLLVLLAFDEANEQGREIPTIADLDEIADWESFMGYWPMCYRYSGDRQFKSPDEVIKEICERNFFPPQYVCVDERIYDCFAMNNPSGVIQL